jgi:hypothetical protein
MQPSAEDLGDTPMIGVAMPVFKFSAEVKSALRKAGWRPWRRVWTWFYVHGLVPEYTALPEALKILSRLGGLTVQQPDWPGRRWVTGWVEFKPSDAEGEMEVLDAVWRQLERTP